MSGFASRIRSWVRGALRGESGFTLIEMLTTTVLLAVVSAPIAGVLLSSSAIARLARERTAADEFAQAQIETIRTLPYTQVGIVGGNPPGTLAKSVAAMLPSGEAVTVATQVGYVGDPVPTAYVTNADYKKIVLTVTRATDGKQLAQKTTYVSSVSAPPFAGTNWVLIKRQVVDAVTTQPLVGASVGLTGGPSAAVRNDVTDGAGGVLFPALDSSTATPPPAYTLATTFSGYSVFPDDLPPGTPESIPSAPGMNSTGTIRMYLPVSLTVYVRSSAGAPYTSGATISVDSSRCGVATLSVPVGQSSVTVTTCQSTTAQTVPLPPNVLGQAPSFDKYSATAWSTAGGLWGAAAPVSVPTAYPTTLTQSLTVTLSAAAYSTKQVKVSVTRGGKADTNARVELTGGPIAAYLYATTDGTGTATFTVPVVAAASTYTVSSNDMGAAAGTATFSASTGSASPISTTVTLT